MKIDPPSMKIDPPSMKIDPPSMKIDPPSIPTSIEPAKIIEEAKETASTATVIADRLVSQIVPSVESMKKEADSLTYIFETKIKLVETKVTQKAEELKEMPEKIINDTIEKLSLELNSVTNDVLSALSSETEKVEPNVEQIVSNVDQIVSNVDQAVESKPEAVSTVEEMIDSIPVALNNVAANISSTSTEEMEEAGSCLALQLDSLGFDTEEFEVKSPSVTSSQVALPEAASSDPTVVTCSSSTLASSDPTVVTCASSTLASSLAPPAGFGVVASSETLENELDQEGGDQNNAEGNESSNCKSKSGGGGNKKNRHKNRRNKNKCTFYFFHLPFFFHFFHFFISFFILFSFFFPFLFHFLFLSSFSCLHFLPFHLPFTSCKLVPLKFLRLMITFLTHSLATHLLQTSSLTHFLTHSLTHFLTHSLHSLTHSLTSSLILSVSHTLHQLTLPQPNFTHCPCCHQNRHHVSNSLFTG